MPWRTTEGRGGRPQDIYVRLDTIDYDSLLHRHLPYYRFDATETFYPQRVEAFVENW